VGTSQLVEIPKVISESTKIRHRLAEAYTAALHSPDTSTQNGAVLYRGDQRIAAACNAPPIPMRDEYNERPLKYSYFEHAERAVILKAAKHGSMTNGTVMYCPYAACADCARAIILAGVIEVVAHKPCMDKTPDRWKTPILIAREMFRISGVKFTEFEESLDSQVDILFDEKPWRP
jgi:deoxycytidylate deaminase